MSRVVDGPKEPQQLSTKLPILRPHRAPEQPNRVSVAYIQLFEIMQNEQIGTRRLEATCGQAILREES